MLNPRRLLVVDDHALVRESLVLMLAQRLPGLRLDEAGSLREALAQLSLVPETSMLLLDLELPDSQGLATLRAVRAHAPGLPVVVLTAHDDAQRVQEALALGAAAFVSKSVDARALLARLQQAIEGLTRWPPGRAAVPWLPPEAAPAASAAVASSAPITASVAAGAAAFDLTERQRDVLRLLVDGLPDKLICRELALSHATVKTHLQALFRKLGVSSRTQAVLAVTRRPDVGL